MRSPLARFSAILLLGLGLCRPCLSQPDPPRPPPSLQESDRKGPQSSEGSTTPPRTAGVESELRDLETKLKELEASQDLTKELKDPLLEQYRLAITRLQQLLEFSSRAADFRQKLQDGSTRANAIREKLAEAAKQPGEPFVPEVTAETTSKQLEQDLTRIQAELQKAKTRLVDFERQIEDQRKRPAQVREQLAQAKLRLDEIAQEERKPIEDGQSKELAAARDIVLKVRKRARLAEVDALEQELVSYDARLELLLAERDEASRDVTSLTARAQATQEAANKRREQEGEQEKRRAEDAKRKATGHPVVQGLADENVKLGRTLEEIGRKITQTTKRTEEITARKQQIDKEFASARQRLDKAGLSDVIGRILRTQRRELPNPREYDRATEAREAEIALVELSLLDIEEESKSLEDLEARVREQMASVGGASEELNRSLIEEEVRKFLLSRKESLGKIEESYGSYFAKLGELDLEQKLLSQSSRSFAQYLDENLLWIRSTDPLNLKTLTDTAPALLWITGPSHWLGAVRQTIATVTDRPGLSALVLVSLLVLLLGRRRLRKTEEVSRPLVGKVQTDGFRLTLQALLADIVSVLPLPLLLGLLSLAILSDPTAAEFSKAAASGVWTVATLFLAFRIFRRLVREHGIAQDHFRWREQSVAFLRRPALWFVGWGVVLPAAFLVSMMSSQSEESHRDSLGRLAFILLMISVAYLVGRVLHPGRGILAERLQLEPNSWLAKLRYVWYPVAVGVPVGLVLLAGIGYSYTAMELGGGRLQATVLLFLGAILLQNLTQRWLFIAHRRIAWQKALEERQARLAAAEAAAAAGTPAAEAEKSAFDVVEEPAVDLKELNQQARQLLGAFIGTSVLVGLWLIWWSVLPALQILDQARVWDYVTITADGPKTEWITLKHFAIACIIALITNVARQNIPGALELTVLQKLPIEPGGRYAITSICQYTIVAVGIVLAFEAVGVGWSRIQWIVAGVSVGLGFGLQEIFANFVSGMILLFERPIRVGDIVTTGDVTGVVTRIRMRATTVRNWDRKELVVPNKEFITGRLLNWTLSDATNRIVIEVGIAYASNTELARETLLKVAQDHPLILDDPPPISTFESFGESALTLVLRCFLPNLENRLPVIHELHTTINRAFREAGIEIAFPQRDLHLRSAEAPVHLIGKEEPSWSAEGADGGRPLAGQ